jgi:hypothetical protein
VADHGRLDVAVNNAGIGGDQVPTGEYPVESWRKVLTVNLDGVFYCMRHELPAMVASGGGVIVNMASILGSVGFAQSCAYVAAKHGVVGLTRTAAIEYATRASGSTPYSELGQAAAHELLDELLGVDAELLEQVGVLVGVDLVGELLLGLGGLVLLAALAEEVEEHVLVELHAGGLPCRGVYDRGCLPRDPRPETGGQRIESATRMASSLGSSPSRRRVRSPRCQIRVLPARRVCSSRRVPAASW